MKHVNHSLFFTAIGKIITVLKEEIGRLEVVFDETLQCKKVLSILLRNFDHFLKVSVQFFNPMLGLAVRAKLKLIREDIV